MTRFRLILIRVPETTEPEKILDYLSPIAEICGVWQQPSRFCECHRTTKNSGFSLGTKFGWWVHSVCKRPTNMWSSTLGRSLFHALGRNLYEHAPDEFKYTVQPTSQMLAQVGVQVRMGSDHPYHRS